jgi:type I restriction enzyme S subunit
MNQMINQKLYFWTDRKKGTLTIASGTTFAELKIVALKKIQVPMPPFELQTEFAQIVEKTEKLKSQYQQSLQELENLYGSLSQRAFRGELSMEN